MDKDIVASKVISGVGIIDFNVKINEALKEGYQVLGEPMMSGMTIYQTVVKYK